MEVLTYPLRRKINWAKPPPATRRVSSDVIAGDGVRFTGSFRTVCHMAWLMERLAVDHPGATLHIIQPPYHTGVSASAGTHDRDACSDVWIFGLGPREAEHWLNWHGFWCWWRHTGSWASPSAWHIHGFTAPADRLHFATKVGVYVDGGVSLFGHPVTSSQIVDWRDDALGLSGQHTPGSNPATRPPRPYPVFNLAAYVRQKEQETMEYKDWSDRSKAQFARDVAAIVAKGNRDLLATQVKVRNGRNTGTATISLKAAIARASNAVPWVRDKASDLSDQISKSDADNAA